MQKPPKTNNNPLRARLHAGLPFPPPKKGKRDECLLVAVLTSPSGSHLMGKRGPGLLEGQWEFPTLRLGAVEAKEGGGAGKEVRSVY